MSQQLSYQIKNSLYLNITDRCTLECQFCPKHQTHNHQVHEYNLTLQHLPSADEVIATIDDPSKYDEIVFCGFGEPTLRLKVLIKIAEHIKSQGGKVRVNTDGLANLIHKHNVLPELSPHVDALSISMNAQNEEIYDLHCKPAVAGSFEAMLDFIETAPRYIKQVTATAINGLEGVDIEACKQLAEERNVSFRQRELDIVG